MASVVARYGEPDTVPYLLPLSVDGLIIVTSVAPLEPAARLHAAATGPPPALPTACTGTGRTCSAR